MLDYSNGKIYKLWSFQTDEIYIGSTAQPLCKRLADHKISYKRYLNGKYHLVSSFKLMEYDDCKIELIENYPCDNKNELTAREGYYIRTLECVNKHIPGRTIEEWLEDNKDKKKEYDKERYENNRDKKLEQIKQYNETNKDKIREYKKQYREYNKDKIKEYYEANKEKLKEKAKEKITCKCGCVIAKSGLPKHKKSKKHQEYINNL